MGARLNTVFFWCNDVAEMRTFYGEVLGLTESFFEDSDRLGALSYDVGGPQMFFLRRREPVTPAGEWASQPGFSLEEASRQEPSWIIEVDAADFDAVLGRVKATGCALKADDADSAGGHRRFFARDPMGNTVEVYAAPPA